MNFDIMGSFYLVTEGSDESVHSLLLLFANYHCVDSNLDFS